MKKIIVRKNDSVAEVIERITESEDSAIVLVVPQESRLKETAANFRLIKKEVEAAGKNVSIESVDEEILSLARLNHLGNFHPLFKEKIKTTSLSDIVPTEGEPEKLEKRKPVKRLKISEEKIVHPLKPEKVEEKKERVVKVPVYSTRLLKVIAAALVSVLIIVGGVFATDKFFAKAQIIIAQKKTSWQYQDTISASKKFSGIDVDKKYIPLEIFSSEKNITQLFPASGKKNVSQKAAGVVTIYNIYSSAPQILVAATRFEAPDGKIYRLDNQVLVPGAKVADGKIIPSSIDAPLAADKPGPDYNVGPIERLTIPGFKGTPRYAGFYGSLKSGTSGGFIGEKAVPTAEDIAVAKTKVSGILQAAFQNNFLNNVPAGFLILDGASRIDIVKLTVNQNTDDKGNFSIFGEADFRGLAFRESDVHSFLDSLIGKERPDSTLRDLKTSYQNIKPDFQNGQMSFYLSAQGVLASKLSAEELKSEISGKKIKDVRLLLLALPGLENAKISVWPFWLQDIPADSRKVNVVIN